MIDLNLSLASIGTEGLLEQPHGWDFGAWLQSTLSSLDGNGNSTKAPQHFSLTDFYATNNVQDAESLIDGVAAPAATSESDNTLISMIEHVCNEPDKNWLAPRKTYPYRYKQFYCPQCLHDLWCGSRELTLQQLANLSPKSYPKAYSRKEDVRRHLRNRHRMDGLQNKAMGS
ncbi:hypothetical protein CC78DRAFT_253836 [Lojkania enalia]|uniref:Uncharacterized protein n=1 Tax=Lojkania enalia TaxID=147567 RepID=A0A9P4N607_9PLEO|nr:hypothetical protein CC78DRAFT_253836 [Didymosphaeria enalia]